MSAHWPTVLLIKSLFLLKVVPEVIDPAMGPLSVRLDSASNPRYQGDEHPHAEPSLHNSPIHRPTPNPRRRSSNQSHIVGRNYSLRIVFPDNCIDLCASEYGLDRQNEHVNIFQVMIEKVTRRHTIVSLEGDP
jgi:hypothetical protein